MTGEFEGIAEQFYADMTAGALKPHYHGGRADLATSPVPAWELFDNEHALIGVAQTSRGCPFECNFCDVIQYVGRVQRHKTNDQVVAEVQKLYDLGYNNIQVADDNFTVYRRRATSLLEALSAWNGRDGRDFVMFGTQISIDIANDDKMLALCADAGFTSLFIGIESVNQESLKASGKRQNLVSDMSARVANVVRHGIDVTAALMVGFDPDTLDIFEQQYDFGMELPVAAFKISVLSAPIATPLYADMERTGRLAPIDGNIFPSAELSTNILPAQMTRDQLYVGTRWLISRLFHPQAFLHRIDHACRILEPNPLFARAQFYNPPARTLSSRLFLRMMRDLARADPEIAEALKYVSNRMRERPDIAFSLQIMLQNWLLSLSGHVRRGSYDPDWSKLRQPPLSAASTARAA
ncbi:MAG: radical SAM protein [Sphingomonadales bacterium]|nr:MAG: radical SAM protein [Sphingomonadales bacterium]